MRADPQMAYLYRRFWFSKSPENIYDEFVSLHYFELLLESILIKISSVSLRNTRNLKDHPDSNSPMILFRLLCIKETFSGCCAGGRGFSGCTSRYLIIFIIIIIGKSVLNKYCLCYSNHRHTGWWKKLVLLTLSAPFCLSIFIASISLIIVPSSHRH